LLKTLQEMGHGDEIVRADAHLPTTPPAAALTGTDIATALLDAILPLSELDSCAPPL
jgi:L-fucose mutarotase